MAASAPQNSESHSLAELLGAAARPSWAPVLLGAALVFAFVVGFAKPGDAGDARAVLATTGFAAALSLYLIARSLRILRGQHTPTGDQPHTAQGELSLQKEQLLLALREIDFDHASGKLNDRDHAALKASYQARAIQVLKALDEDEQRWRAKAEALLAAHLKRAGVASAPPREASEGVTPKTAPTAAAAPTPSAAEAPSPASTSTSCAGCGQANDADARFCKACGAALEGA